VKYLIVIFGAEYVQKKLHVIWLRYAIAVAAILITGRIHSGPPEQDELDRRPKDISANPVEAIDSTVA
jgi:hypothetical protein